MTGPLLLVLLATTAQQPVAGASIVNAAAARLRATPSIETSVVAQLPLGTELTAIEGGSGEWTRVRTSSGSEGWISSRLITAVSGDRLTVIERIIRDRLARQGDGFAAQAELVAFVQRIAQEPAEPETRTRFALHDLRATAAAARAIPFSAARTPDAEPYASWLKAREGLVFYNEVSGGWMVNHSAFVEAYERHRGTVAADDILWESVLNGLGGECETDLACHLNRITMVEGEYLRREPRGRHNREARLRAVQHLESIAAWIDDNEIFVPARDCADTVKASGAVSELLVANEAPFRTRVSPVLQRIATRCSASPSPG